MNKLALALAFLSYSTLASALQPVFKIQSGECTGNYQAPQFPTVSQETGYLKISRGQLFYWLVNATEDPDHKPLVIWLNGGPGSPSILGMWMENGPYRLNDDGSVRLANNSWNQLANILYIDQPAGVGYSVLDPGSEYNQTEDSVGQDMLTALHGFISSHPAFASRDVYVVGESFGGVYVPWIAHAIENDAHVGTNRIPLKGVGIVDGVVDEQATLDALPEYALSHQLISQDAANEVKSYMVPNCDRAASTAGASPSEVYQACNPILEYVLQTAGVNYYDIRLQNQYDFTNLTCYLSANAVKQAIGVPQSLQWVWANDSVYESLITTMWPATAPMVGQLLGEGLPVLVMNGDQDLIVNYVGTEKWADALSHNDSAGWSRNGEFAQASWTDWQVNGRSAGKVRQGGGLKVAEVFQSGHLVPMDQPEAAFDLLKDMLSQ